MSETPKSRQADKSVDRNISFFRDNLQSYGENIRELDTYVAIRASTNQALTGIRRLLDIGNGGVFDYDVGLVPSILALDLFLDDIDQSSYPAHVTFKTGSALEIPAPDGSFDGVLMVMLLHHLAGETVAESLQNVRRALGEAMRVMTPGGKLIIVESCVPEWFYAFERVVFRPASRLINLVLSHPITIQYPVDRIVEIAARHSSQIEVLNIPKGRWVLQYGFKFPSALTPVNVYRLTVTKPLVEAAP